VIVAEADTKKAEKTLAQVRARYLRRWTGAVDRFYATLAAASDPEIALVTLVAEVHAAIDEAWPAAWKSGQQLWGGAARLAPDAAEGFAAVVRRQKEFATRFAVDLAEGIPDQPGRVSAANRIAMYGQSLEGPYQRGAVDAAPPGQLIDWVLGACQHCILDAEARVLTRRGEVPIVEVVPGDEVLTHRARWRRVTATHAVPLEATTAARAAFVIEANDGRRVRLTGDHKVLTDNGWHESSDVAETGAQTLQLQHVTTLRDVLGTVEIESPYAPVPEVPADVRMRPEEIAQVEDVCGLCRADEGPPTSSLLGRPGEQGRSCLEAAPARSREPAPVRGSAGGALHAEQAERRPSVRVLPGRGWSQAPRLSESVEVGAGERPDPARHGDPPRQRGPDRRPAGESATAARFDAQAAPQPDAERLGLKPGPRLRHLRRTVSRDSSPDHEDREAVLRSSLQGCLAVEAPGRSEDREDLSRVRDEVQRSASEGTPAGDVFSVLRRIVGESPQRSSIRADGLVEPGATLYDLTIEEDHSYIVEGFVVANCVDCPVLAANGPYTRESLATLPRAGATTCRSRCCCSLSFRTATDITPPSPEAERPRGDMLQALTGPPPPVPPGRRLPTDDERRTLQDLQLRMAFANRRADAATTPAERDRWLQLRRELNGEMIRLTKEARVHYVPTFSTAEVLRGADLNAGNVDALTHLRGLDGTTIHRAQAEAIHQALDAARKDLDQLLSKLPAPSPAVPALGVQVTGAGQAVIGPSSGGQRESLRFPVTLREAASAALPTDGGEAVVNVIGAGAAATLSTHLLALRVLASAPYRVEVGPLDAGWEEVVAALGTWIRGPVAEVDRFVRDLASRAAAPGIAVAPWQEAA
jgi:hypothetical protein